MDPEKLYDKGYHHLGKVATEWETVLTNYTSDRGYYLERLRTKNTLKKREDSTKNWLQK